MSMQSKTERERVYRTLVSDLAHSDVPTAIMGLTVVGVGLFSWLHDQHVTYLIAMMLSTTASAGKLALMRWQRHNIQSKPGLDTVSYIENAHWFLTTAIAISISAISSTAFISTDIDLHLLATGLIFGYCSGVVSRISVRPWIAMTAISVAAIPSIIAATIFGGLTHIVIAGIFTAFLGGAFQSINHAFASTHSRITLQMRMASLASTDHLTGLANRLGLKEAFDQLPATQLLAVHLFDLDGFKSVNDLYGHAVGDDLLRQVAARIILVNREHDITARIGGDEFVVVQRDILNTIDIRRRADAIFNTIIEPFLIQGKIIRIGVSIGFTVNATSDPQLDGLLNAADSASYKAKRRGGGVACELQDVCSL